MNIRWEADGILCEVCKHDFFNLHFQVGRTQPYDDEERRRKCRDCRKCKQDEDDDFASIVKGIKDHNRTAPERKLMPV